ncbi:hypothetical protein BGX27_003402 [Mortierella sp. AM989]|nr:hypothetical protein BGX27_003402 [Mortierella sp. AM989]
MQNEQTSQATKRAALPKQTVESALWYQKSVRLNTAIVNDLENLGVDVNKTYLVAAETRALAVDFYTLKRHGDVFGAGRATERRVWLPEHPTELMAFLRSDSL